MSRWLTDAACARHGAGGGVSPGSFGRRVPLRWIPAAACLALTPKCLVCLAAYAGIGAALGVKLGGPEICGVLASPTDLLVAGLPLLLLPAAVGVPLLLRRRRRMTVDDR